MGSDSKPKVGPSEEHKREQRYLYNVNQMTDTTVVNLVKQDAAAGFTSDEYDSELDEITGTTKPDKNDVDEDDDGKVNSAVDSGGNVRRGR